MVSSPPREADLGPHAAFAFPFDSPFYVGSVRMYCLIRESLGASVWYMILIPTVKIQEIKAGPMKPKVKLRCVPAHHQTRTNWSSDWFHNKKLSWSKMDRGDGKLELRTSKKVILREQKAERCNFWSAGKRASTKALHHRDGCFLGPTWQKWELVPSPNNDLQTLFYQGWS